MTVSLGPKRLLGANTLLGASQFLGQGNTNTAKDLEYELLFSTDDASVSIPTWTYLGDMRSFSTNRGRGSELDDVDAGTASIVLDNRARKYDPTNSSGPFYPNLRPMNRVWLRMRFNGVTHDIFKGWVESYEQQYPSAGIDAVTVVHAVDEFKVLALRNLPTSDPPRDTYADLIQFDNPVGYWRMSDDPASLTERAEIGPQLVAEFSSMGAVTDGAIAGDNPSPYAALTLSSTGQQVETAVITEKDPGDMSGLSAMTVELWFKTEDVPSGERDVLVGPPCVTSGFQYYVRHESGGALLFGGTDSGGTAHNVTATTSLVVGQWTHVVGVIDGSAIRIYINGVQSATASWSGVIRTNAETAWIVLSRAAVGTGSSYFDEVAIYSYALPAARVLAHYNAGANRGFARGDLAGKRIGAILDSINSQTPRNLLSGARPLAGQYGGGGAHSLDLLREAENAEAVDAVVFVASDGTITFLDGGHRSTSPWNTVQATFGDAGGSELDFMDISLDYSDSFLANEWNVTRDGGTVQTTSDSTSIGRYLKRPQSLTDLKLRDDADAADVAADMLAKYKDPLTRVLSITPKTMDLNVANATFPLDIGDRIRVLLTPPGGGSRFDQILFVQSVQIDADPASVFPKVVLGVSPV